MAPSDPSRLNSAHSIESSAVHPSFSTVIEEKPIWTALLEGIRDTWFPPRLPELELTSTPVPVPDRMAGRTNRWAVGTSTLVNGSALAVLIFIGLGKLIPPGPHSRPGQKIDLSDLGLIVPSDARDGGGGGGGGSRDLVDPIIGRASQPQKTPLAPLQIPLLENPQLAIQPAIAVPVDIQLPDNPSLPNIGVRQSVNVSLASAGPGTEAGLGTGARGGDGSGNGSGYGPGTDRGVEGGAYKPGIGGVSLPVPLVSPEAEFSDEARRAKYQGICAVQIVVDTQGYPRNLRVVRTLGMGLDQKALEAVSKYRFKPALKNGKPVPAIMTIEVNFRLY